MFASYFKGVSKMILDLVVSVLGGVALYIGLILLGEYLVNDVGYSIAMIGQLMFGIAAGCVFFAIYDMMRRLLKEPHDGDDDGDKEDIEDEEDNKLIVIGEKAHSSWRRNHTTNRGDSHKHSA